MSLLDRDNPDAEDSSMSPEDKERVSLQIAATEARTEAHMAEISGALAVINQRLADRDHAYDARFAAIEQAIRDLSQALSQLRTTLTTTTIVTAITVCLTTIFGVADFNATLLSGMVTSFDSGRDIGGTHAELQRQIAEINATLKRLEARQPAEAPAVAPGQRGERR
ncbi:MAG TPA: hypothetical protein VGF27_08695 [Pseudoduganella sp.]